MTLTLDTRLRIGIQTIHRRTEPADGAVAPAHRRAGRIGEAGG